MKEIEQKLQGKISRLTNKTFKFDSRIGEGWFSAVYFLKTKKIVEEHSGQIHVDSSPDAGTTFTLELPVSNETAGANDTQGPGSADA